MNAANQQTDRPLQAELGGDLPGANIRLSQQPQDREIDILVGFGGRGMLPVEVKAGHVGLE